MLYTPTATSVATIVRPVCAECGFQMMLSRIEPDRPGYEIHTFECTKCWHQESVTVKFR